MRFAVTSALLTGAATVNAVAINNVPQLAPALPLDAFNTSSMHSNLNSLDWAMNAPKKPAPALVQGPKFNSFATSQCSNPRIRVEWDNMNNNDRQAFINGIKCLKSRPGSGQFSISRSRYDDLVALHQMFTPNVHGNAKFLVWHRYFLWTFEDLMRSECGYTAPLPWFDETKYAGHFRDSSIFTSQWFGSIAIGGNCVTDGQFANTNLYIGPGSGNQPHCLARNGNGQATSNCNSDYVNSCNSRPDYADMENCSENGPHGWGHNGVGAVMADVYGSPGDPVFFLHHAFVDHSYRIWQNQDSSRVGYIDGTDHDGNALTLNTPVSMYGIRPNVPISSLLNTQGSLLCYRYDY